MISRRCVSNTNVIVKNNASNSLYANRESLDLQISETILKVPTLHEVLHIAENRENFLLFLKQECSEENLLFWHAIEMHRNKCLWHMDPIINCEPIDDVVIREILDSALV
eukprot:Awhi_evm1s7917